MHVGPHLGALCENILVVEHDVFENHQMVAQRCVVHSPVVSIGIDRAWERAYVVTSNAKSGDVQFNLYTIVSGP